MTVRHLAAYLVEAAVREATARPMPTRPRTYRRLSRRGLEGRRTPRRRWCAAGDRVSVGAEGLLALCHHAAALFRNACYVPIDYTTPVERGRNIIADAGALITTKRNLERLLDSPSPELQSSTFPRIWSSL